MRRAFNALRSLLDVNVLIALLDGNHVLHNMAHEWFRSSTIDGWASCPIVENGVVRVMTGPNYKRRTPLAVADVVAALAELTRTDHQFWPDDISITDPHLFAADRVHGPGQLTDVYLLALAINNKGRFVTFDRRIPLNAVPSAKDGELVVIEPLSSK
jgi:toxin-antitoxin system PIN domain toxin